MCERCPSTTPNPTWRSALVSGPMRSISGLVGAQPGRQFQLGGRLRSSSEPGQQLVAYGRIEQPAPDHELRLEY
jgi:hypothetical protein